MGDETCGGDGMKLRFYFAAGLIAGAIAAFPQNLCIYIGMLILMSPFAAFEKEKT